MQSKKMKSLSEIVDKMNKAYDGLIGQGFSPGVGRRVVPVMAENEVLGWKMQRYENEEWVDLDETPFTTIEELIAHYKNES
jgi:hypothetical protein